MNHKGTTLIEILISVVLIATIMVFMFNILVDLKNEESLSTRKSTDTLNRSSIIHLIQNDFISKGLSKVSYCDNNDCNDHVSFTFTFKDNSNKILNVYTNYLTYDDELWELANGEYLLTDMTYCLKEVTNSSYYYFNINIPVSHDATSKRKYDIDITEIKNDSTVSIPSKINYSGKDYYCN